MNMATKCLWNSNHLPRILCGPFWQTSVEEFAPCKPWRPHQDRIQSITSKSLLIAVTHIALCVKHVVKKWRWMSQGCRKGQFLGSRQSMQGWGPLIALSSLQGEFLFVHPQYFTTRSCWWKSACICWTIEKECRLNTVNYCIVIGIQMFNRDFTCHCVTPKSSKQSILHL